MVLPGGRPGATTSGNLQTPVRILDSFPPDLESQSLLSKYPFLRIRTTGALRFFFRSQLHGWWSRWCHPTWGHHSRGWRSEGGRDRGASLSPGGARPPGNGRSVETEPRKKQGQRRLQSRGRLFHIGCLCLREPIIRQRRRHRGKQRERCRLGSADFSLQQVPRL